MKKNTILLLVVFLITCKNQNSIDSKIQHAIRKYEIAHLIEGATIDKIDFSTKKWTELDVLAEKQMYWMQLENGEDFFRFGITNKQFIKSVVEDISNKIQKANSKDGCFYEVQYNVSYKLKDGVEKHNSTSIFLTEKFNVYDLDGDQFIKKIMEDDIKTYYPMSNDADTVITPLRN